MQTNRLVVVSNRVAPPVGDRPWTAGGLVAALQPAVEALGRVMWFGWSGEESEPSDPPSRVAAGGVEYATISLSPEEVSGYYEGFCNQVLWPLLHGLVDRASLEAGCYFDRYREVNERFASALYPMLEDGDLVWVHDYHLIPMGAALRRLGWSGKVGYFNHTPIPEAEGWWEIPHGVELAEDFAAYDRIGVQTKRDARRLRTIVGTAASAHVDTYPVSIDPARFRSMLVEEPVSDPLGTCDDRLLYFGVDRLDYTKGIPQRLHAFERAITAHDALREGARFVQWAAPSRTNIPEYQQEKRIISAATTRIRRHPGATVNVEYDTQPPPAVAAALRRADVCVVTSLADGMNLVAKEFAAVHSEEHPGVLILSDTCGASEELVDALVFPGGNVEALARAMQWAFEMPLEERRERSRRLRATVDGHTSTDWLTSFVRDLAGEPIPAHQPRKEAPAMRVLHERVAQRGEQFAREQTIRRIWDHDYRVWKPEPTEIANRLGWLDVDTTMKRHVSELEAFAGEVADEGYRTAALLGMGGSSLAPQVFAATFEQQARGLELLVLDSTVPSAIRSVEARAPRGRTLFIASSKSGTTLESLALLEYFWAREPDGRHFVAITDAGTPLEALARERGFRRVFLNPSDIGGRYSALSYVGLVPAALLQIDLDRVLAGAARMREACGTDYAVAENPGAHLGITLAEAALLGRDCLTLQMGDGTERFGAWLEQLIAESTGKEGRGILPVLGEPLGTSEVYGDSRCFFAVGAANHAPGWRALVESGEMTLEDPWGDAYALGAEFFRWEFATAVAGHILGINPFDQPDVETTKRATALLLGEGTRPPVSLTVEELLSRVELDQYVAIHAYVARTPENDARLERARVRLRDRLHVPTTVEYGPSLLHSTGQYHKGGQRRGAFIQIVEPDHEPLPIPGRGYTFNELVEAQAAGDRVALVERGRLVTCCSSLEEFEGGV